MRFYKPFTSAASESEFGHLILSDGSQANTPVDVYLYTIDAFICLHMGACVGIYNRCMYEFIYRIMYIMCSIY